MQESYTLYGYMLDGSARWIFNMHEASGSFRKVEVALNVSDVKHHDAMLAGSVKGIPARDIIMPGG